MKLKKKFAVIFAAVVMAASVSPFAALAAPETAESAVAEEQTQTDNSIAANAASAQTTSEYTNKKYLTKGGAAFWFVFTIVLNGALSFWIGNRFYRLAKKDNHVSAEIRALRRDIESKFVNNIDGFTEQEVDIKNNNESLAMTDEGIKPVERKTTLRNMSEEDEERFRRWEEQQSKPKTARTSAAARSHIREELDENLEDVRKIRRKNYQPKRETEETAPEDDFDSDLDETREIKIKNSGVKDKAKEILGDIFPFKED